jgi:glutamyl-tRNA synthetase
LKSLLPLVRPRMRLPKDLFEGQSYFFGDPADYDEQGMKKHLGDEESRTLLKEYMTALEAAADFRPETLEAQLRDFAETKGVKAGKIIHGVRLGLTGKTVSPGLFEMMDVLGRETVLRRLHRILNDIEKS